MDYSYFNNSIQTLSDGIIENITSDNNTTLITVSYANCRNCRRNQQIRLVLGNNTLIFDEFGNAIPASDLTRDMIINATFSSAFTRSLPPQSVAFFVRIVQRPVPDNIITGRIIDINREYRRITTISNGNLSSAITFNVPMNTRILNSFGRPISFSTLIPGLRVRIRHADFMTASIPPQTTAFEIRVIR